MSCRGFVRSDRVSGAAISLPATPGPGLLRPSPPFPLILICSGHLYPPVTPCPHQTLWLGPALGALLPWSQPSALRDRRGGGQASPRLRSQQVHPLAAAQIQGIILDSSVPCTPHINPLESFIRLQNYSKCTQFSLSSPLTPQPWPRSSPTCTTNSALRLESCPPRPPRTSFRVATVLVFSY